MEGVQIVVWGTLVALRSRGSVEVVDSIFVTPVVQDRNLWAPSPLPLACRTHALSTTHVPIPYSLPTVRLGSRTHASQESAAPGFGISPLHQFLSCCQKNLSKTQIFSHLPLAENPSLGIHFLQEPGLGPRREFQAPRIQCHLPFLSCRPPTGSPHLGDLPCYPHLPAFSQTISFPQSISHTTTLILLHILPDQT